MRVAVLGYGASGKAAEALAKRLGHEVEVRDARAPRAAGAAAAVAVVSPGVPLTSPLVADCRARGIPLKSELQFGCEELRRQGWKLVAVTGSKGKSSVVKAVADALSLGGRQAVACGNYGKPVCEVALEGLDGPRAAERWAVVEVSSFMMETTDLPPGTFEAAAILNLQEDHLDRHGSVEAYHGLKRRLLGMARAERAFDMTLGGSRPFLGPLCGVRPRRLYAGSYFDNEVLSRNALAAAHLMAAAGLDRRTVRRAFAAFAPLPHRMSRIGEFGGVVCIDDSKATSLAALAAGVRMACRGPSALRRLAGRLGFPWRRRVRLVAGGLPKGDSPKIVRELLTERVKKVYLIGASAEAFADAWKDAVACEICGTLDRAVASAMRESERGETILLSPGAASFDQFGGFGERGDVFARLVKKEGQKK